MSFTPMISDIVSGILSAVNDYLHHRHKHLASNAAFNVVASMVGRLVSYYLSGGLFDRVSLGFVHPGLKNYLSVAIARTAIAMFRREPDIPVKVFECLLCDAFAQELTNSMGADMPLINGWGCLFHRVAWPEELVHRLLGLLRLWERHLQVKKKNH